MGDVGPVDAGLAVLEEAAGDLSMKEVVDRVERVTTDPATQRKIIDTAEIHGVIDRADGVVRTGSPSESLFDDLEIVERDGAGTCKRCGQEITSLHFIKARGGELGPYGPECVEKVADRGRAG